MPLGPKAGAAGSQSFFATVYGPVPPCRRPLASRTGSRLRPVLPCRRPLVSRSRLRPVLPCRRPLVSRSRFFLAAASGESQPVTASSSLPLSTCHLSLATCYLSLVTCHMTGMTNSVRDFGQYRNKPDKREMKPASFRNSVEMKPASFRYIGFSVEIQPASFR